MNKLSVISSSFSVPYQYDVVFTENLFQKENSSFADLIQGGDGFRPKVFFVIEETVSEIFPALCGDIMDYARAHSGKISMESRPLIVSGGESCKNYKFAEDLCRMFLREKLCRQSYLAVIGGGALLDAAGFAAAIFHRGIRQIRIPTTALAQCDSGVGVKNAVNAFGLKNLLGTFAPPYAVVNDSVFLTTLPMSAISSAAAEAIKVATIKDAAFFHWLEENARDIMNGDPGKTKEMIRRSAEIHVKHISTSGDPFELGSARPLDFGHWSAHKMEALSEGRIGHGTAVGTGLLLDTLYAVLKGIAPRSVFDSLFRLTAAFNLPFQRDILELRDASGRRLILDGLEDFREHLGGKLHITLPVAIGSKTEVHELDASVIEEAIEALIKLKTEKA